MNMETSPVRACRLALWSSIAPSAADVGCKVASEAGPTFAEGLEAAISDGPRASARERLATFWRRRGGAFQSLRGSLEAVRPCEGDLQQTGCVEATTVFEVGRESFSVEHDDLTLLIMKPDISNRSA